MASDCARQGLIWNWEKFLLDTKGVVKCWSRLPRAVMWSPFLGGFKRHVDVGLREMVLWWALQYWVEIEPDDLRGFSNPNDSMIVKETWLKLLGL